MQFLFSTKVGQNSNKIILNVVLAYTPNPGHLSFIYSF